MENLTFKDLGLSDAMLKALEKTAKEMLEQPEYNFFRIGYYVYKNPNTDLSQMSAEEANEIAGKLLDEDFMLAFIALEKIVSNKSPDFTKLHSFIIVLGKCSVRVVKLCDGCAVITQCSSYVITERTATQIELISPRKRKFISQRPEVCTVCLRF